MTRTVLVFSRFQRLALSLQLGFEFRLFTSPALFLGGFLGSLFGRFFSSLLGSNLSLALLGFRGRGALGSLSPCEALEKRQRATESGRREHV